MNEADLDGIRFQREGYLVVRSVFSADEVTAMRTAVVTEGERARATGRVLKSSTGEVVPVGDIAGVEGLEALLFDERVVRIARTVLGTRNVVYFGDSGVMIGGALRGFHKDNTCRDNPSHPDWQSPYAIVRMGVYLQDHIRHSGGLKVRVGSHLHPDVTTGRIVSVPTAPGDVVVWNLRTTHSGHAARVRGLPRFGIQPRFEARLPRALLLPEPCTRLAIFATYASPGAHLDNYVAKHADQVNAPDNYLYLSWLHSDGSARVQERAERAGVSLLRAIPAYGERYAASPRYELGYVPAERGKADRYDARGLELAINQIGRGYRFARSLLAGAR